MTARPAARRLIACAALSLPLLAGCGAADGGFLGGSASAPYAVTAQSPSLLASAARPVASPIGGGNFATSSIAPLISAASAFSSQGAPKRSNAAMAQDLTDLIFVNEAGERRATLARWEGPARVRLASGFAEDAAFLDSLLADFAGLTGLEIRRVGALEPAEIKIRAIRPARFEAAAPGVLCGSQHAGNWRTERGFRGGIVDIPADASQARRRLCLIEEIAQLLGPVNDLERLPDSIFNDDGAHLVMTPFDRLMLRILYAQELQPGMSPEATRAAALQALARLNPAGIHGGAPSAPESTEWSSAYRAALAAHGQDHAGFAAAMSRLEAAAARLPRSDHRRVKTLTSRAAAALSAGDSAQAGRLAAEARGLAREAGDSVREAEALGLMARAAQASGDSAGAANWAAETRRLAAAHARWDLEEAFGGAPPAPVAPIRAAARP